MALQFAPDSIIHATDIRDVESSLGSYVLELCLLGEISLARELVSTLFRHGSPVRAKPIQSAVQFAWSLTDEFPRGEDVNQTQREEQKQRIRNDYSQHWGKVPEDLRRYDEEGLRACLDDRMDGRTPRHPDGEVSPFADATTGWIAMLKGERLTKAFEISVRLKCPETLEKSPKTERLYLRDLDVSTAHVVKSIVGRWNANQARKYLAEAESLWPLYARGLLANALDLNPEEVRKLGQEIVDVFRERLKSGYAETQLSGKSVGELLKIGDHFTMNKKRSHLKQGEVLTGPDTLYKPPATHDDITKLETQLGLSLPSDYKDFLSITDGFEHGSVGIFNGYSFGPDLLGTSHVQWIVESYFQLPVDLLGITHVIHEILSQHPRDTDSFWQTPLPLFDRVLQIGTEDIYHVWLIQPDLVQKSREVYEELYELASEKQKLIIDRAVESFAGNWEAFRQLEWCCATWAAGGSASFHAYSSFRRYLEAIVVRSQDD